jgi:hypothetical protein
MSHSLTRTIGRALLVTFLCSAGWHSAAGQEISPTDKAEIKNLVKAAREAAEAERALNGPLAELLLESDELICEAWVIKAHTVLRDLSVQGASSTLIAKAQALQWKIEQACADADKAARKPGEGMRPTRRPLQTDVCHGLSDHRSTPPRTGQSTRKTARAVARICMRPTSPKSVSPKVSNTVPT